MCLVCCYKCLKLTVKFMNCINNFDELIHIIRSICFSNMIITFLNTDEFKHQILVTLLRITTRKYFDFHRFFIKMSSFVVRHKSEERHLYRYIYIYQKPRLITALTMKFNETFIFLGIIDVLSITVYKK